VVSRISSSLRPGDHLTPIRKWDRVVSSDDPPKVTRPPDLDAEWIERPSVCPETPKIGRENRWNTGAHGISD
jgi:hypothetical protein